MSELTLGRMGYGAANVGNLYRALTDDEAWRTLEAAWDSGVRYFDTAPHYGLGLSERRLGAFLATKPRDEFVLSTKVGRLLRPNPAGAGRQDDANNFAVPADLERVWDFTADGVRSSLDESLVRLGLDSVDVLYLHDPERHDLQRGIGEGLPALAAVRDEGLVSVIGVGSMDTEALLAAARSGVVDLLMVAGRLTLVDQSVADRVLPACRAHQVGIVAAAVFNSGLLATDTPSAGSRYDYRQVPGELLARTRRIAEICAQYDVPLPVAALQYPLQQPQVRSVVVGGARPEQVRQNAARLAADVPAELWKRLDDEGLVEL
ncbi:MAG: aldo/keto reductase [Propionibacteriales bacterium]|nr:aldo/keto reductase [Propionibacteriales bacterium]